MSEFKELVKSFSKTREYVRDFFVYGFKTRDDFTQKSARTYDNERRRLESWLPDFVRQDYTAKGKNISPAIDSNLLDTNPLYRVFKTKSFTCMRMDTIKKITALSIEDEYISLSENLNKNLSSCWGVSFQNTNRTHLEWVRFSLEVKEPYEHYIVNRLERDGKGGVITQLDATTYQFEKHVFDANEMLPWIRTFIGRIVEFHCSSSLVEKRFYRDLQTMYHMYEEDL